MHYSSKVATPQRNTARFATRAVTLPHCNATFYPPPPYPGTAVRAFYTARTFSRLYYPYMYFTRCWLLHGPHAAGTHGWRDTRCRARVNYATLAAIVLTFRMILQLCHFFANTGLYRSSSRCLLRAALLHAHTYTTTDAVPDTRGPPPPNVTPADAATVPGPAYVYYLVRRLPFRRGCITRCPHAFLPMTRVRVLDLRCATLPCYLARCGRLAAAPDGRLNGLPLIIRCLFYGLYGFL